MLDQRKMADKDLITFIKEARKRGFDDIQIRKPLMENGWPMDSIEDAFASLKPRPKYKSKISIFLDSNVIAILQKRAEKNFMTLSEQIDDILRRSCLNQKKPKAKQEKLDDSLVPLFSRKKR